MKSQSLKNVWIGLFFLVSVVLVFLFCLFFRPHIGDGEQQLQVRFSDISGLGRGTHVTYAGLTVGEVLSISRVAHDQLCKLDDQGRIYPFQLVLRVDSKTPLYQGDEIVVRTAGLMGEKSIAIVPKGGSSPLHPSEVLFASSSDSLERTLKRVSRTAESAQEAIRHSDQWLHENEATLSSTLNNLNQAVRSMDVTLQSFEQNFAALLQELQMAAADFRKQSIGSCGQIMHNIANGQGTVGQLVKGDDLYLRLSSLLGKGELLLSDINSYGILFHYNKQWKRSRAKRISALEDLNSPATFANYCSQEVDAIRAGIGRLEACLEQAEDKNWVKNPEFEGNFATLLRQIKSLHETAQLYNQRLLSPNTDY